MSIRDIRRTLRWVLRSCFSIASFVGQSLVPPGGGENDKLLHLPPFYNYCIFLSFVVFAILQIFNFCKFVFLQICIFAFLQISNFVVLQSL